MADFKLDKTGQEVNQSLNQADAAVPKTRTIAGLNLESDITNVELTQALSTDEIINKLEGQEIDNLTIGNLKTETFIHTTINSEEVSTRENFLLLNKDAYAGISSDSGIIIRNAIDEQDLFLGKNGNNGLVYKRGNFIESDITGQEGIDLSKGVTTYPIPLIQTGTPIPEQTDNTSPYVFNIYKSSGIGAILTPVSLKDILVDEFCPVGRIICAGYDEVFNTPISSGENTSKSYENYLATVRYPGTEWKLVDKKFSPTSFTDAFTPVENVDVTYSSVKRSDHSLLFEIRFKTKIIATDDTVKLGTFDRDKIGVTSLPSKVFVAGINDGAGGYAHLEISEYGSLYSYDTVPDFNEAYAEKHDTCASFPFMITDLSTIKDEACDKFYYKRIS